MYSNVSSINFHSIQLGMKHTNLMIEHVAQKPFPFNTFNFASIVSGAWCLHRTVYRW